MLSRLDRLASLGRKLSMWMTAFVIVAAIRATLAVASYRRVQSLIPRTADRYAHPAMSARVARAVSRAAKYVPGATCLTQALAVRFILALRGFTTQIRIGVAQSEDGHFTAHAWVTSGGLTIIGGTQDDLSKYKLLTELPARTS